MRFLPKNTSGSRYLQKSFCLKILLFILIALVSAKSLIDLSTTSGTIPDRHEIDALAAEAYQKSLAERNEELVEGSLHEPSDPARVCQSPSALPTSLYGTTTLTLQNAEKVKLTITDCHPCKWPIKLSEDIPAYAQLEVKGDNNLSISIQSYIGGTGERSSGTFSIRMPKDSSKRIAILQIIQQIGEYGAPAKRQEYNQVLRELFSPGSPTDAQILGLAALLCKSIDASLMLDKSPR